MGVYKIMWINLKNGWAVELDKLHLKELSRDGNPFKIKVIPYKLSNYKLILKRLKSLLRLISFTVILLI